LEKSLLSYLKRQLLEKKSNTLFATALLILSAYLLFFINNAFQNQVLIVNPPKKNLYNTHRCSTGNQQSNYTLNLYVFHRGNAYFFSDQLCNNKIIQKLYNTVSFHWQRGELNDLSVLQNRTYQLLVDKPGKVEMSLISDVAPYKAIARYKQYKAFLIGRSEIPVMSLEYLSQKKIGLLDKFSSQSGHIIPKKSFREAHIEEKLLSIVYKKSHSQLRNALENGEVDIISSYWNPRFDNQRFNKDYLLELKSGITPTQWYLDEELLYSPVHCVLLNGIKAIAKQSKNQYFNKLVVLKECKQ
jgi:phosphonate transport system substrate-binding protein